jgi:parallel beta-helix repeat protein
MNRKAASLAFATVILLSPLMFQSVNMVSANFMPMQTPQPAITIQEGGTVSPSSSPIIRNGNTYTLTEDIIGYTIVIDCDNINLDGANRTLQGRNNIAGVFVKEHNNVNIQNLNIHGFKYSIMFTWLSYGYSPSQQKANTISNNTLTGNTYGIYFGDFSQGNTLSANTVENNTYGIYLASSSNNLLRNNRLKGNEFNFFVYGSASGSTNDVDTSNTVDGKPIIYWTNQQNKQVPSDAGYVALVNCVGMTVQKLNLSHNGQAILLVGVSNSTIESNTLTENDNAIWIINSNNLTVTQNVLLDNHEDAIYMVSSNNTTIKHNVFVDGGSNGTASEQALSNGGQAAIWISSSANNVVYNNTFSGNGEGISLQNCNNHLITYNLLSSSNGTTIHLYGSAQNNITNNIIADGRGIGVKIWSSDNNVVQSNLITDNVLGILLDSSAGNSISENMVANNTDWGIQLKSASDTFMSSIDNIIIRNNFINNKQEEGLDVSIPGIWSWPNGNVPGVHNAWDNGYEGNYWGDYKIRYPNASEVIETGIWNTPWMINENNIDYHPLTEPIDIHVVPASEPPEATPSLTPSTSPSIIPTQTSNPPQTTTSTPITTQTTTPPSPTSTTTPTPPPSVPEFPTIILLSMSAATIVLILLLNRMKRTGKL